MPLSSLNEILEFFPLLFLLLGSNTLIPNSLNNIITSLKLNISLTLIGVITGEFLVSKEGIGYLIIYGTQVFDLTLVMSGIFILIIISYVIYKLVSSIKIKK